MGNESKIDITIPCGDKDPPYTYIRSGSAVVAENINEYYTATNQHQSDNGETYCCAAIGGTTCYQLNITCAFRLQLKNCFTWAVIPQNMN